ncbi:auxin-responsive protein IAA27-like [Rutidosis leptorrhynchoides]|uniref:auxin-responsive protein IAA27-like n=1 Tax=Rutidosis leptorrhynchoides TaxID=125765 RepID=UPI003A99B613
MSVPLEHDYIGLANASSIERSSESSNISSESECNNVLNLKATELRLGLPGFSEENGKVKNFMSGAKRGFSDVNLDGSEKWDLNNSGSESDLEKNQAKQVVSAHDVKSIEEKNKSPVTAPSAKAQVVGWPPIRSFRKNTMATSSSKNGDVGGCLYVKVSMDGAPYLRKIDLKMYHNYAELSKALEKMFSCFTLGQFTSNGIRGRGLSESNIKDLLHGSDCVLTYEDKDGDWMLVGDVPWDMFIDSCKRLRITKGSEAIGLAPRSMDKCKNRN